MRFLSILAAWLTLPVLVAAQTSSEAKATVYDDIWRRATEWYSDTTNPIVQRVQLSGRLHYEFAAVESDGDDHSEWNLRRLRIGPRITLFRHFTLHSEVELDPQRHDPFYDRMTDFYVQWTGSPRFVVTVGKQSVPFTVDGATSSRELLTMDRSNLANNIWFPQEYLPGVSVSGRRTPWVYRVGLYSAGEANREFGAFNGGAVLLGVLGYDFARSLGVTEALLSGNYVHQNADPNNTFTRSLENVASVNFRFENEKWGARSDFSVATGYLGQSDLWAFQAMPFFNVTDRFQTIARYTYLQSEDPNGIRFATYESRVVEGKGDRYAEFYLGLNYYLYGHRLKLQSGLQFADMRDRASDGGEYSGLAWTTGLRVGW